MRLILAILLLAGAGWSSIGTAKADQRWCAISNEGASNCGFASMPECRAQVAGTGGNCMPEAPVGHLQPNTGNAGPAAKDQKLDALLDRVNKKNDKLQICRGC